MKRFLIVLVIVIGCLSVFSLSACSNSRINTPNPDRYNALNAAQKHNEQLRSHGTVKVFSDKEVDEAKEGLLASGVFSESELSSSMLETATSRAQFISLLTRAAGVPVAEGAQGCSASWYAPYVSAAYNANMFPKNGLGLTFLPVDGFLLGDNGWRPMLENMSLEDANAILEHMFPESNPASEIVSDEFKLYEDSPISRGDALVCAWRVYQNGYTPQETNLEATSVGDVLAKGTVIHAGGFVDDSTGAQKSYSNTAEALVNAYEHGGRLIEFDFTQTSDNNLAAIHDWIPRFSSEIQEGQSLSLSEWLDIKIYDTLSPLCIESIASFMRQHPDLYIMTDVKSDNLDALNIIKQTCPDLQNRFVIQIYNENQYDAVRNLGFPNIVYTIYNISAEKKLDTTHLVDFAKTHPLLALTFPESLLETEGYVDALLQADTPLCTHTLNDAKRMKQAYDMGITAIYTDNVE